MSHDVGATKGRAVARVRTGRGRRWRRTVAPLALGFGMVVAAGSTPKVAHAEPSLEDCVAGVSGAVSVCLGDDPWWGQRMACEWAGGVGIIACIAAESAKMATRMLPSII